MLKLPETMKACTPENLNNGNFRCIFKAEMATLEHHLLPLQQGLIQSSTVSNEPISAMILSTSETPTTLIIKAGLFYTGITAGCSCSDDPAPMDTQREQCVIQLKIDKITAEAEVILLDE
ncbi:hypothetical protein MNBD_GAMMA11-2246 [hydrothermal vent metagenome]|uniref:Uncharacterized protein n=1 Tax=hydrothermal vent metagenome TaxID=652676 RepID=A0A3B0XZW4_9ZZZZ